MKKRQTYYQNHFVRQVSDFQLLLSNPLAHNNSNLIVRKPIDYLVLYFQLLNFAITKDLHPTNINSIRTIQIKRSIKQNYLKHSIPNSSPSCIFYSIQYQLRYISG